MNKLILAALLICSTIKIFAQDQSLHGMVQDSATHVPLSGITVRLVPLEKAVVTNQAGKFLLNTVPVTTCQIVLTGIGYQRKVLQLENFRNGSSIYLSAKTTELSDVVVSGHPLNPYKAISETDIKLRGVSNSQEVLRIVPGLFIGQHQGGGKAEQIFLRGFDNDHGTDINLSVDGLPINMVSQAHGQGYADSHFIIPETIESTTYEKGMYNAQKGDLAVTGYVDFHTADAIDRSYLKAEAGQYNTYRLLGMTDLLSDRAKANGQSWYAASEYRYSNSYFDNPQHFQRFNFFSKYHARLGKNNWLTVSASTLYSRWKASGQIPDNAVDEGIIGFYGALDPNEGGITSRTNVNAQLLTELNDHDLVKNQLYYSRYKFDLYTNFTFYLEDPVNGDEIRQREARNLFGYNGSYLHESFLGNNKLTSEIGLNARLDATDNSELSHTVNNIRLVTPVKFGDITEFNGGGYFNETLQAGKLTINAGLRFDQFSYRYLNKLASDSTLRGVVYILLETR